MKITFRSDAKVNIPIKPIESSHTYAAFMSNGKDSFVKNNDAIKLALNCLDELEFEKKDIEKVNSYGARLIFKTGKEAVQFAKNNNIPIIFGKVDQPDVHAQWVNATKTIIINDRYKTTTDIAEIYAISAAILHELSHAKDNDGISSIQEEIDCLAMNALAFNVFKKKNPDLLKGEKAPIIKDGVDLYTNLFLGNDKKALIERIKLKYGNLLIDSPNHPATDMAFKISNMTANN